MKQAHISQGKFRAKEKEIVKIFSEKVLDKQVSLEYNELIKNGIGS